MWAENSLFAIGRNIAGSNRTPEGLEQAREGAEALLAITEELLKRADH